MGIESRNAALAVLRDVRSSVPVISSAMVMTRIPASAMITMRRDLAGSRVR
jgi:hypothetical protein